MAGIPQEETPIEKMLLFSSKHLTSWPSGDIISNPYDKKIKVKFQVGWVQPI